MTATETIATNTIQQAVIEKLALLSLEQQQRVLTFTEELAQPISTGATLWEMAQACLKDVPPEDLEALPADGAFNHDHYLYGAPKRYDEQGNLLEYEQQG